MNIYLSSEEAPAYLFDTGGYTTQLYGVYTKQL